MSAVVAAGNSAHRRWVVAGYASRAAFRCLHYDHRQRLSKFWTPTQRQNSKSDSPEDGHDLLVRAGFLRPAHAGIFHLLPLGLRVLDKVERLIDKHMTGLGASKVSLSSISSESLWQRSGRLDKGRGSEFLRFEDRKGGKFLLAPTHEEEITTIAANAVHSYKDLPLRLYQVSRKYRDEPRPRQGLLRGREFVMKDLYTFDASEETARSTYESVRQAYAAFFDELKLPYIVATADSGNMGGDLSHEYHFASPQGEDTIISCSVCGYTVNEEKYAGKLPQLATTAASPRHEISQDAFLSRDGKRIVCVFWPGDSDALNTHVLKSYFADLDTGRRISSEDLATALTSPDAGHTKELIFFHDPRISRETVKGLADEVSSAPAVARHFERPATETDAFSLTKAREHDACPQCSEGKLRLQQAVEIGHTFHLGNRYSEPLHAQVLDADDRKVDVSMGCHGIGVSRLIGAAASLLASERGLNWPLAIAPFGVAVVPGPQATEDEAEAVYDLLEGTDAVLDDRAKPVGWKLNDADLIGYPFIVILGKAWKSARQVELQCRRLDIKENVGLDNLRATIESYAQRL